MNGILGKKIGMTQIFAEDGSVVPVSVIETGPCEVVRVKSKEKDRYDAFVLGFSMGQGAKKILKEFKNSEGVKKEDAPAAAAEASQEAGPAQVKADIFKTGDYVNITGTSIGKGFQGGYRRWNWKGGDKTHGSTTHRRPGSIGSSTTPGRVIRGHHLPGRMGGATITVRNLEVVKVDAPNNLLLVKGAVPGPGNNLLIIHRSKKIKKIPIVPVVSKEKAAKAEKKKEAKPAAAKPAAAKAPAKK